MQIVESGAVADQPESHPVTATGMLHHGWVWNVVSESFRYGDTELTREFIAHTGAVAVLALDENDRALLLQQYRHPARSRDWELPAGLLDAPGEDPLAAAQRELAEEADLQASEWHLLLDFWTSPGGSNESIRIYLARGLQATAEAFNRQAEEADIRLAWIGLDEAIERIFAGQLHNPAALQALFAANESRRQNWATLRPADTPWDTRPEAQSVLPRAIAGGQRA